MMPLCQCFARRVKRSPPNGTPATPFASRRTLSRRTVATEQHGHAAELTGVLMTDREALALVATKRIAVFDHRPMFNEIDGKPIHLVDQCCKGQLAGLELNFTFGKCRQTHRHRADAYV